MHDRIALVVAAALAVSIPVVAWSGADPHAPKPTESSPVGNRLEPGSNSFTEAQVKAKFFEMGFGEITDLRKDDEGIWHGKATHAGKQLSIGMDYKGNVAAE